MSIDDSVFTEWLRPHVAEGWRLDGALRSVDGRDVRVVMTHEHCGQPAWLIVSTSAMEDALPLSEVVRAVEDTCKRCASCYGKALAFARACERPALGFAESTSEVLSVLEAMQLEKLTG